MQRVVMNYAMFVFGLEKNALSIDLEKNALSIDELAQKFFLDILVMLLWLPMHWNDAMGFFQKKVNAIDGISTHRYI